MEVWACVLFFATLWVLSHKVGDRCEETDVLFVMKHLAGETDLQGQIHLEIDILNMDQKQHWWVLMDAAELGHSSEGGKRNGQVGGVSAGSLECDCFAQTSHVLFCKSLSSEAGPLLFTKDAPEEKQPSHLELQECPWKGMAPQNPSLIFQRIAEKFLVSQVSLFFSVPLLQNGSCFCHRAWK